MKRNESPSLDNHLVKIARGGQFFRSLYSLALLWIVFVVVTTAVEIWRGWSFQSGEDAFWGGFLLILVGFIRALPSIVVALAFRHMDHLFKAVHGALDDLRTTV